MSEQPPLRKTRGLDINVLPQSYRRRRLTRRQLFIIGALLTAVALLFPMYLLISNVMSQNAQLELDLRGLTQQVQAKREKLAQATQLQTTAQGYNSLTANQGKFSAELEKVTGDAMVDGITLDAISLLGGEINIGGTAGTDDAHRNYRDALKQQFGTASVEITSISQEFSPPRTFTITIRPGK